MITLLLCLIVFDVVVFLVGLWQLEIVWIGHDVAWGYDFGGFGDFGLQLWNWRDVWYSVLLFSFLMIVFCCVALCVYVYSTIE